MNSFPTVDITGTYDQRMHPMLAEAACRGPLAVDELSGAIVALRQHDVEALAHDQRIVGVGLAVFDLMGIDQGPLRDWYSRLMFTTEGDYHRRMRSLVSRGFTPRSVATLRTSAAQLAAAAVASAWAGDEDLVPAFSTLATRLMCELLGVPDEDITVFARWADALSPVFQMMTAEQIADATDALANLRGYVDDLTRRRAQDPGPDMITALLDAETDGEQLSHDEVVTMIANLLVAGHDTAGSQIPCSILVTLDHLDQLPGPYDDALLANLTNETMRLEPSIPAIPRTTMAPIELHDTTIPAGSLLYLCIAAANRDATAWNEPEQFDPERFVAADAPRLLSFGAGTHFCLGTALARIAVEESLRAVAVAHPALKLSENRADIPWRQVLGRSPARLLVSAAA